MRKYTPRKPTDPLYYFWRDLREYGTRADFDWNSLHRNAYYRLTKLTYSRYRRARGLSKLGAWISFEAAKQKASDRYNP